MKKILYIASLILIFTQTWGQNNVSFTIKPGTAPNKAKVFIRSNADKTGVISQTLLTFTLPATITPRPTASIAMASSGTASLNFTHLTQTLNDPPSTETISGTSYHVWTFYSAYTGSVTNTLPANTEVEFAEVTITNAGDVTSELRLASVPDGGTQAISYLLVEMGGTNLSNATSLTYGPNSSNSPSGFSGYSYVPLSVVLPVKFLSFYALKNDDNAKLNWTVEGDEDNKYFEVERSTDGRVFKPLSKINALGNGRSVNTYETVDQRLSGLGAATVYYRIKQTDINGNIVYSSIKNLNATRKSTPVQILPNPAKTTTKLVFDADNAGKGTVLVRDMQGKLVLQYSTTLVKGINQQEMNVSGLASGDYNVTVSGQGFTHLVKMSKIN